jgi:signal transduction histidine kinase
MEPRMPVHDADSDTLTAHAAGVGAFSVEGRTASSRAASRCLELLALQARATRRASVDGARDAAVPSLAIDTATVMNALAPLFGPDAPACFRREPGQGGAAVRRMLVPMGGDRKLAIDVVPQVLRFSPNDLQRLLLELVDNGRRHSAPGSTVRVRGAPGADGYQLSVTNPGAALPRNAIAALRPSRRGTGVRTPVGWQLGLPIAATLAELNEARLEVVRGAGRPNTLRVIARTD